MSIRAASPAQVGLIDGRTITGRILAFSEIAAELIVEVSAGESQTQKTRVESERVAYVGFKRHAASELVRPTIDAPATLRVHVAGGATFEVTAPRDELDLPLGFHAWPTDAASPYSDFFFYAAGVNAKESTEPLGSMLVSGGVLDASDLSLGVAYQSRERKVPIGQILVQQRAVTMEDVEAARQLQARRTLRIGEVLVEQGLATPEEIEAALGEQKQRRGRRLGHILVDMQIVSEVALYQTLARKFHMPFVDLDEVAINPAAALQVGEDVARKFGILPLDTDGTRIVVAISDPLNTEVQDVVRFSLGKSVQEVLAAPSQLARYLENRTFEGPTVGKEMDVILRALESAEAEAEEPEEVHDVLQESDSAVVRLVNQIIIDAVRVGASDIHIEPNGTDQNTLVRVRVDGQCSLYQTIPPSVRNPVVARIKIMAHLDISEKRRPQDGKIRFRTEGGHVELRVATIPTVNGNEDVVLRILASSRPLPLDDMGLAERNLTELKKLIVKPYGLILCVGPTGSGKTTTLHSALGAINTVGRKIWTAEDPVEITQPGLRQVQVRSKIGFTFAAAMRAFLRADPDVIMIGEMRDQETANTAIEASLTGHLVLSTLHTNSAPETITRLLDMGLDPFTFSDALLGVMAQRLARSLCKRCRQQVVATETEYDTVLQSYGEAQMRRRLGVTDRSGLRLWNAPGCDACKGSGYKGRIALHELLVGTDPIKAVIQRKGTVSEIRELAMGDGMTTLLQDGIEKAVMGKTDLKQVLAVCSR